MLQKRTVLRFCESKVIDMPIKLKLPHAKNAKTWLLSSLLKDNIDIESNTLIKDSNSNDFIKIEALNRNFNADATIRKNQELAFITLLNEGKEKYNVSYKIIVTI